MSNHNKHIKRIKSTAMSKSEYDRALADINFKADMKKKELAEQFALSNNHHSIGDTIKDHIGKVEIEEIKIYLGDYPSCIYVGKRIKVDGTAFKSGERRAAYQLNLIE